MNPEPKKCATPPAMTAEPQTYQIPTLEFLGMYSQTIGQIGASITSLPSLEET
jgi:hypothetical protein